MADYVPPDPAVAEWVHRLRSADEQCAGRLRDAPPERLKGVARDGNELALTRSHALARLASSSPGDPELPDLLLALLAAPDAGLRASALCMQITCPIRPDPRLTEKARDLLRDPDATVAGCAAILLAIQRDGAVLPQLLAWFYEGDARRRAMAVESLRVMGTPEAVRALRRDWEQGGRGEEDRVLLAAALLRASDPCGRPFLEAVARRGDTVLAAWAAIGVSQSADRAAGLRLMRRVIDHGTPEAKRAVVLQIAMNAPPGRLPHAFTADGIHEARLWIDQQLQAADDRRPG